MKGLFIIKDGKGRVLVKKHGLFTRNMAKLMASLLGKCATISNPDGGCGGINFTFKDINGNTFNSGLDGACKMYPCPSSAQYYSQQALLVLNMTLGGSWDRKVKMVLGGGTTAPTPDDYAVEDPLAEVELTNVEIIEESDKTIVKWTGSASAPSDINVTEAGIYLKVWKGRTFNQNSKTSTFIMLDRVTFSAKSFSAGQTITVEYIITLQ